MRETEICRVEVAISVKGRDPGMKVLQVAISCVDRFVGRTI
jgi:hypothetical protein